MEPLEFDKDSGTSAGSAHGNRRRTEKGSGGKESSPVLNVSQPLAIFVRKTPFPLEKDAKNPIDLNFKALRLHLFLFSGFLHHFYGCEKSGGGLHKSLLESKTNRVIVVVEFFVSA